MNKNIKKLLQNHLHLKDYFLENGLTLSSNNYIKGKENHFSVEEDYLTIRITEYYTTANIELCLAFMLANFTKSEIKQLVSMFEFHHNLFGTPLLKDEVYQIMVTDTHMSFTSKLIELQITKTSMEVYQDCSFFETVQTIKPVNIKSFHKAMIKQLPKSLSIYFNRPVKAINNNTIQTLLNESVFDYNERINSKPFFKACPDYDFYKNITNHQLSYLIKEYSYNSPISNEQLIKDYDLVILKQTSERAVKVPEELKQPVEILIDVKQMHLIRKVLTPVFKENDLSYLLSIISLMHFIENIKNPYSNDCFVNIEKEPTLNDSREYVYDNHYIFNISFADFSMNIGRETELISFGLYDYDYKTCKSDNFKTIYTSLVKLTKKIIKTSLDIENSEVKYDHIKLIQMQNS